MNEPGNSKLTQQFLPTIIDLCTTALYPAIREVKELFNVLINPNFLVFRILH